MTKGWRTATVARGWRRAVDARDRLIKVGMLDVSIRTANRAKRLFTIDYTVPFNYKAVTA